MQIENHKEEVPFSHYTERFRNLDPEETAKRLPFADWDGSRFAIVLLGRKFFLRWPEYEMTAADDLRSEERR